MLKRDVEWIKLELFGYGDKWKTRGELWEHVPRYRRTHLLYKDNYDRPVMTPEKFRSLTEHAIGDPIGQVEDEKYRGMRFVAGITDYIREKLKVPVFSAQVSDVALKGIVESVRNRALEFVNNIILELEYGDILSNIFEETRKVVDSKLVEVCPSAVQKLTKTHNDIVGGSSSLAWSQIAYACRDILQDYEIIQKHTHPEKFKVEKEDAHRCVIYTYLIIGDILKVL